MCFSFGTLNAIPITVLCSPYHPCVRCIPAFRPAQTSATLWVQYDACDNHLRRDSIRFGQPLHSVSVRSRPSFSFPSSIQFAVFLASSYSCLPLFPSSTSVRHSSYSFLLSSPPLDPRLPSQPLKPLLTASRNSTNLMHKWRHGSLLCHY